MFLCELSLQRIAEQVAVQKLFKVSMPSGKAYFSSLYSQSSAGAPKARTDLDCPAIFTMIPNPTQFPLRLGPGMVMPPSDIGFTLMLLQSKVTSAPDAHMSQVRHRVPPNSTSQNLNSDAVAKSGSARTHNSGNSRKSPTNGMLSGRPLSKSMQARALVNPFVDDQSASNELVPQKYSPPIRHTGWVRPHNTPAC